MASSSCPRGSGCCPTSSRADSGQGATTVAFNPDENTFGEEETGETGDENFGQEEISEGPAEEEISEVPSEEEEGGSELAFGENAEEFGEEFEA